MSCEPYRQKLAEDPEAAEREPALSEHLAACPACRELAQRLARVDQALAGLPAPGPTAELLRSTLARVAEEPRPRPVSPRLRALRWAGVGVAASAALLVTAGLFSVGKLGPDVRDLFSASANALGGQEQTVRPRRPSADKPADPGPYKDTGERAGKLGQRLDEFGDRTRDRNQRPDLPATSSTESDLRGEDENERIDRKKPEAPGDDRPSPGDLGLLAARKNDRTASLEFWRQAGDRDGDGLRDVPDLPSEADRSAEPDASRPAQDDGRFAFQPELRFLPARGYFRNTYLPGDPELTWLRESLSASLELEGRRLAERARPYRQPFDAPERAGLALSLDASAAGLEGPTRLLLQIGLKGAERPAHRRSALDVALVMDLRELPDDEARQALWGLADALASARQAGDRFFLVVAGAETPLVLGPEAFEPARVRRALADALLGLETRPASPGLAGALEKAYAALAELGSSDGPLGSQLLLLASAGGLGEEQEELAARAHRAAREGVSLSALGVGTRAAAEELAELAQAGQGRRRLVTRDSARSALEAELAAGGAVVARAVRLRIRLADGVRLVGMLGSEPLLAPAAGRVREAEQAIDQRLARTLGIEADRGQDEDGIQVVIPAFYAGDEHVILLDVVAPGPGPLADVQVRFKDLVGLANGVVSRELGLPAGGRAAGRREALVEKNALAFDLAAELKGAAGQLARGDARAARAGLERAEAALDALVSRRPQLRGDPELGQDRALLADCRAALDAAGGEAGRQVELARALRLAGKSKLAFARPR
jgi:hypothetical protein